MAHLENAGSRYAPAATRLRVRWPKALRPSTRWIVPGIIIVLLVVWEWLAQRELVTTLFFPPPSEFAKTFVEMAASGEMALHLGATLKRVALALVLGGTPALLVGLAMGWSDKLRLALDPVVAALHPLPKIAVLPLVIIVMGLGEQSSIAVIAFSAFFPMLISAMTAVQQINPTYIEVARQYGANRRYLLTDVVMPAALPILVAGLRLTLNTVLVVTIAIELIMGREGLGRLIWFSWQVMQVDRMYASLMLIGILGMLFNQGLAALSRRLIPWSRTLS